MRTAIFATKNGIGYRYRWLALHWGNYLLFCGGQNEMIIFELIEELTLFLFCILLYEFIQWIIFTRCVYYVFWLFSSFVNVISFIFLHQISDTQKTTSCYKEERKKSMQTVDRHINPYNSIPYKLFCSKQISCQIKCSFRVFFYIFGIFLLH